MTAAQESSSTQQLSDLSPKQLALLALKEMQAKLNAVERAAAEPIAIIGLGCRFPGGVVDAETYWQLLYNGVDAISEVPPERWSLTDYYDADPDKIGKMYSRFGGFLENVDQFDARFFGITPREAISMDPQQRLLLEVAWEAIEDAGLVVEALAGSATGVFIGISNLDYSYLQAKTNDPSRIDAYIGTGNALSVASGRLSYLWGLQGPSLSVDTACSSSLVTVHLACQSLRNRESNLALAGGVNLILSPDVTINFSRMKALAPDGRCKAFDASANGYVRGEGCGVVVMKRLSDALADHDSILAVICGSAVNQDGRSSGLTVPNGLAQQAVIKTAISKAGLDPSHIGYIEAHGTGTSLGDPIEIQALSTVLSEGGLNPQTVGIGSVKSNFGHAEAAAGIAGLIKSLLAVRHGIIPPHLHLRQLNPILDWSELPVYVATEPSAWHTPNKRYAGVSSFGFSGTNAHIIIGEAPQLPPSTPTTSAPYLLTLSARSKEGRLALAERYSHYLGQNSDGVPLHDICYTATMRRNQHEYGLAVVGNDHAEIADKLTAYVRGEARPGVSSGQRKARSKVAFVIPGQGAQWIGMARSLINSEPTFRQALEACAPAIEAHTDWALFSVLESDSETLLTDRIDIIQPTLFAISVSLAAVWRAWGIQPDALIGHSFGEIAAAYLAGALSLEQAALIVCTRSRLMQQASGQGSMLAVEMSWEQAQAFAITFDKRLSVAVNNSSRAVVLSGDTDAIQEVAAVLSERGIFCRMVKVNVAAHSPQMDRFRPDFMAALDGLVANPTQLPFYSTVKGQVVEGVELDAAYWVRNLRTPVLFEAAARQLFEDGYDTFIELSPHPILSSAVQQIAQDTQRTAITLASMRRGEPERAVMLESLGQLYTIGYKPDWQVFFSPETHHVVPLPQYPWQRERHWLEGIAAVPGGVTSSEQVRFSHPDWLYLLNWQEAALITPDMPPHGDCFIVTNTEATGLQIAQELGYSCHILTLDVNWSNEQIREKLRLQFTDLKTLKNILFLWNTDCLPEDVSGDSLLDQTLHDSGLTNALILTQTMMQMGWRDWPRLWLIMQGAQYDPVNLLQAPLWGLGRTISLEHSELRCTRVDLSMQPDSTELRSLIAELQADGAEDQIVLRSEKRFVARLTHPDPAQFPPLKVPIRNDPGYYLITGGLGALGLKVAAWLSEQGATHIVLVGRHDPSEQAQQAIDAIQRGTHVQAVKADVANRTQLAALFETLHAEGLPLRGIVHAAGLLDDGILLHQDEQRLRHVLAPKVDGAWNLHLLTKDAPLDFFVMFSSATSLLGSPGQGNYAAANAFMDMLAHYRHNQGLPALSINWGPWDEIGLAVQTNQVNRMAGRGFTSLTPQDGMAIFAELLQVPLPQVGVLNIDRRQWQQFYPKLADSPLWLSLPTEDLSVGSGQIASTIREEVNPERRRNLFENHLRDQISQVIKLSLDQIDSDASFGSMGFDSLMALELRNRLERSFGITLSASTIWSYPTIRQLIEYLSLETGISLNSTRKVTAPPSNQQIEVTTDLLQLLQEAGQLSEEALRNTLNQSFLSQDDPT